MEDAKNPVVYIEELQQALHTDLHEFRRIVRKIDRHVLPIAFACCFLQFLDKVLINYANVMGLQKDLHMKGNDFSWMATAFFIAYALAEIPQAILLQRFPVTYVLGGNVLGWAILVSCSATAQRYRDILAIRTLLGALESAVTPSLILITGTWYTKRDCAPRFGALVCSIGVGQILGGLVSFGAQHGPRTGFSGWRIMMVAVGPLNLAIALWTLWYLPSSLEHADFLSTAEKQILGHELALDQAGNGTKTFRKAGVLDAICDLQVWLLGLLTILVVIPSGVITTFSAIIVQGFGYTPKESALLNMPSGIVSIVATIAATYAILKGAPRWLSLIAIMIPQLLGAALMVFLPTSAKAGKMAGVYLINTTVAPMAIVYTWLSANTAGYTKRVTSNAMVSIAFGAANIIGPQPFQSRDAPLYIPAKITIFAVAGAAILACTTLRVLYGHRNRTTKPVRIAHLSEAANHGSEVLGQAKDGTDRTDAGFVYVY